METTPLRDRAPTFVPTTKPEKMSHIKSTGYFMEHEGWRSDVYERFQYLDREGPLDKEKLDQFVLEGLRSHGLVDSISNDSKVAILRVVDSRSRLGSATRLRHRELLGDLKQEPANVDQINVPRWLLRNLSSVDKVELHGFGDASESKELMGQRFTSVLRIRMAKESPT